MTRSATILSVFLVCMCAVACDRPGASTAPTQTTENQPASLRTVTMQIGSRRYTLEVADDPEEQQTGLMHRTQMPADCGMIFVFPFEEHRNFWMRNTLIPLDILYIDSRGKVVSIKTMKPRDETNVPSDFPAQYAIELNAGQAAECGVKVGHVLQIPPAALAGR